MRPGSAAPGHTRLRTAYGLEVPIGSRDAPVRVQHGEIALPSLGQPPGCQRFLFCQVGRVDTPQHILYEEKSTS